LAAIAIDLEAVTARVEEVFGPGALDCAPRRARRRWRHQRALVSPPGTVMPFTPNAKKCLEGALRQAVSARDGHIGVAHMAVSLLSMSAGMAPRILSELGVPAGSVISLVTERTRRAS
jgi:Clp amino terminal domain, pathogenicity island component